MGLVIQALIQWTMEIYGSTALSSLLIAGHAAP